MILFPQGANLLPDGFNPLRIMIISDAWEPQVNGVVRTLRTTVAELRKAGKTVEVIGPNQFKTIPLPFYPEIKLALFPSRKIARLIKDFKPDALHIATEGPLGIAARAYAVREKINFTTAFHTRFAEYLEARTKIPARLTYKWLRWFHAPSAAVMVATPSLHEDLAHRGFKNLCSWSRGVDLALFQPTPRQEWPYARPIFIYVGRVAVEKNLRAFLELDLPGSKLIIGDGPQRKTLERDFPTAHFAGAQHGSALAAAYAGGDIFVFPSKTDTFGLVVLEALASGLPVAAYPVTGPKDILQAAPYPVGVLDEDLKIACLNALTIERSHCRPYAEEFSWKACAERFVENLVSVSDPLRQAGYKDQSA